MTINKEYNLDTIVGTYQRNAAMFPQKPCLKSRYDKEGRRGNQIHSYIWSEVAGITWDLSCALYTLGFREFDRLAIFAPNRPRFMFAAGAAIFLRGAMVPIYSTSSSEDVRWILDDSGSKFCFCAGDEQLKKVLEARDGLKDLEQIVVMSPLERDYGERVVDFNDLLALGRENRDKKALLQKNIMDFSEEDLVTIFYTSGTTGLPKGVMLTNRNIVSQRLIMSELGYRQSDLWMAHLPFCHSYGFSADLMGCGYLPGVMAVVDSLETDEIRWALTTYRPTVMNSVPRLWEKIYLQINALLRERPSFIQKYFWWASGVGRESYLLKNKKRKRPLGLRCKLALCRPIFFIVKKKAGLDRLRFCTTGGAAISSELIIFFGGLGIEIYQGYGLTETSPIINVNTLPASVAWAGPCPAWRRGSMRMARFWYGAPR